MTTFIVILCAGFSIGVVFMATMIHYHVGSVCS